MLKSEIQIFLISFFYKRGNVHEKTQLMASTPFIGLKLRKPKKEMQREREREDREREEIIII